MSFGVSCCHCLCSFEIFFWLHDLSSSEPFWLYNIVHSCVALMEKQQKQEQLQSRAGIKRCQDQALSSRSKVHSSVCECVCVCV